MKTGLVAAVVVVLVILVAALASPLLGLQALRDAVATRDVVKLEMIVDVDRLRGNVAARVRARYAQPDDRQLTPQVLVEPLVERLVTPEGLLAAICDGGAVPPLGAPSSHYCDVHGSLGNFRFESANRYSAALTQGDRIAATVVMDRAGLRWKLVDLVLPAGAYDQLKNSILN